MMVFGELLAARRVGREGGATVRRRGSARITVTALLVVQGTLGLRTAIAGAPRIVGTAISTCSFPAFQQAVERGGAVTFAVSCPDLIFSTAIGVSPKLKVTVSSGGKKVVLDGAHRT